MKLAYTLVVVALLLAAAPTQAHDIWIEVEPFRSAVLAKTKIYLFVGEHFREAEPVLVRARDRVLRFALHSSRQRIDLLPRLREDSEPVVVLDKPGRSHGTYLVAYDAAPRDIEIAADRFQAYLLDERLIDILALRADRNAEDTPGRERYTRHLKALVQAGGKTEDFVTRPIGQDLEIVPVVNPYQWTSSQGQSLTVQVLFRGQPLARRAVTAANRYRSDVAKQTFRTDKNGHVTFRIDRPGDWMIQLVHMEPSTEAGVDWRSFWATLTFSLGG